jgi:hypothetical protein
MQLETRPKSRQVGLRVRRPEIRRDTTPADRTNLTNLSLVAKAEKRIPKALRAEVSSFLYNVQRIPSSGMNKKKKREMVGSVRDLVVLFSKINSFTRLDGHGEARPDWVISQSATIDGALADIKRKALSAAPHLTWDKTTETMEDEILDSGMEIAYDLPGFSAIGQLMRETLKTSRSLVKKVSNRLRPAGTVSSRPITNAFERDFLLLAALTAIKSDLTEPQRAFLDHAKSRMECWKEGFAVLCALRQKEETGQLYLFGEPAAGVFLYLFGPKKANGNHIKSGVEPGEMLRREEQGAGEQIFFSM